jgi:UDPglucose--hexose-1-phosphate uridylyltransferase
MSELRKDPVIGRWVIIASERGNRPGAFIHEPVVPDHPAQCPFCEGNERMTPGEILAFRPNTTRPNERGWWVRVVPNKYPAMQIEGQLNRMGRGMFDMMQGIGAHEVIVETPTHDMDMADMRVGQIEEILWAYRGRMIDLHKDLRFRYVMIFKNHGAQAGATIGHSHSQIIALPIVPKRVIEEVLGAQNYFRYKERCVYCDVIHQEDCDMSRVIDSTDQFIAFHPFASRFPYETWIVPRQHEAFFSDIQMNEVSDLAGVLKRVLERFKTILNSPPYNFVIHTAPFTEEDAPYYHWHIELIPRLSTQAGFEWGTGFYINPVAPEDAARRVLQTEQQPREEKEGVG